MCLYDVELLLMQENHQQSSRKTGNRKKRPNRKKKGSRKQQRNDETACAAPPIGDWQQCNGGGDTLTTKGGSGELDEVDAGYEKYWVEQGEYLVWEGWTEKYPGYMTEVGTVDGIPAVREEEVCCDELEDVGGTDGECQPECVVDINRTNDDTRAKPEDATDVPSHCDDVVTNEATIDNQRQATETLDTAVTCTSAVAVDVHPDVCTRASSDEPKALAMHDYARSCECDEPGSDSGDTCQATSDTGSDTWEARWTEHYAETYWYYYNQYRQWFGGGDHNMTDVRQLPIYSVHLLTPGEKDEHCGGNDVDAVGTDAANDCAEDKRLLDAMAAQCSIADNECVDRIENDISDFEHDRKCVQTCTITCDLEDDRASESMTPEKESCCNDVAEDHDRSHEGELSDGAGERRRRKQKGTRTGTLTS